MPLLPFVLLRLTCHSPHRFGNFFRSVQRGFTTDRNSGSSRDACIPLSVSRATGSSHNPRSETSSDNVNDVFARFATNIEEQFELRKEYLSLIESKKYAVAPLVIKECNAGSRASPSFSNAICAADIIEKELFSHPYLFKEGHDLLSAYIKSNFMVRPESKVKSLILSKLLTYLLDTKTHSVLKNATYNCSKETILTAALGQHFFSRLGISEHFFVDKYCHGTGGESLSCLCGCGEHFTGIFRDNSIGHPNCWHGSVDMILNDPVPVIICAKTLDLDTTEVDEMIPSEASRDEVKISQEIQSDDMHQIIAETIVFSFIQKKMHPEYDNYLIPSIGASKQQIMVFFYDALNDVLLQGAQFPIFLENNTINYKAVIAAWMTVNYRYFCTGLEEETLVKIPKANFGKYAGEYLSLYQECLKMGQVRQMLKEKPLIRPKLTGKFNTFEVNFQRLY